MESIRGTLAYLFGRRAFEERHHRRFHFAASLLLRTVASGLAIGFVMAEEGTMRMLRMVLIGWTPAWLFTPELMAAFQAVFSGIRQQALADVQGQYYAFKGKPIRVVEWVPGERWLAVDDLERVLGFAIGRPFLRHAQQHAMCMERDRRVWLSTPAVLTFLDGHSDLQALKLRQWVHGTVWLPSAQARRLGKDRWQM